MRKLKYVLLTLLMLCGCSTVVDEPDFVVDRTIGITEVTYDELTEKIENNHDFILYIGRSDCGDCIEFAPYLDSFMEENQELGVYYLDVKAFRDRANSENATQEEKDFFKSIYDTLEFDWTPTLQHRRGSTILSSITYLSMEYYDIKDEKEKEQAKQENLNEINDWLKKECE